MFSLDVAMEGGVWGCQVASLDQHPPWWLFRSLPLIFETVCYRVSNWSTGKPAPQRAHAPLATAPDLRQVCPRTSSPGALISL